MTPVAGDLRCYVVNLRRRPDRRRRMEKILPPGLNATFTSDWDGPFDWHNLSRTRLEEGGYELFPWPVESANPWWRRPLKLGEIGCTLNHLACWKDAAGHDKPHVLILEDDVILGPRFLDRLQASLACLDRQVGVGLLYLGRLPLEPDTPAGPGFVSPGYSHCTFGYLLHRSVIPALLNLRLEHAIIPVDEFLSCLYADHPRPDLRARFPPVLEALACEPPLVTQLPKQTAGSDTEDSPFTAW